MPRPHSLQHQLPASPSDVVPKTFCSAEQQICNPQLPLSRQGTHTHTHTKQLLAVQDKVKAATEHLFPKGKDGK